MEEFVTDTDKIDQVLELLFQRCGANEFKQMCDHLDKVYLDEEGNLLIDFRHQYSAVSGKLNELKQSQSEFVEKYGLDIITSNTDGLYEYAKKNQKPYLKNLFKLKDHISLEIARIDYKDEIWNKLYENNDFSKKLEKQYKESSLVMEKIEKQSLKITNSAEKMKDIIASSGEALDDAMSMAAETKRETDRLIQKQKKKMKDVQKDYIAILGILAAVLVTFTSGSIFSSSVLANMHKSSIYRIVLICLILGFVLVNLISLLMQFMKWILGSEEEDIKLPELLKKIDAVLLILIVLDILAWFFDVATIAKIAQNYVYKK